jgi:ketosteroid isomerase-like protein
MQLQDKTRMRPGSSASCAPTTRPWFRSGRFDYHKIDIDDRALSVSVTGDTATVAGRGIFDATINGMHAPWRLALRMTLSKQRGTWRIMAARYSSFWVSLAQPV